VVKVSDRLVPPAYQLFGTASLQEEPRQRSGNDGEGLSPPCRASTSPTCELSQDRGVGPQLGTPQVQAGQTLDGGDGGWDL
jgi:hypothetical protein